MDLACRNIEVNAIKRYDIPEVFCDPAATHR
jgi:hypothetical protein